MLISDSVNYVVSQNGGCPATNMFVRLCSGRVKKVLTGSVRSRMTVLIMLAATVGCNQLGKVMTDPEKRLQLVRQASCLSADNQEELLRFVLQLLSETKTRHILSPD